MNISKTQTGFAHLMIIAIIVVIGLVGGVGYIVYQNMNKQPDSSNLVDSFTGEKPGANPANVSKDGSTPPIK